MGPDTPITQVVSGQQYIANTTVQNVSVSTTADTTVRKAASIGYIDEGGMQDSPAVVNGG